jgi:Cof subfamily protein (haloacid dehalogenase superfamily)
MKQDIRLIAIDLDGTTVQHDVEVNQRVLDAVAAAQAAGVRVVIATGRNVAGVRFFSKMFGITGPVIAQQGGLVYDLDRGEALRKLTLDSGLTCEVVAFAQKHPQWKTSIYAGEHIFVEDGPFYSAQSALVGFNSTQVDDLCVVANAHPVDKVLFVLEPSQTPQVLSKVTGFIDGRANVVQSHAQFVEVNPLGADKGTALAWLSHHLGFAREQVMAIGDQHNDMTMLGWAGLSVAMGNARPELKDIASWVAPTVEEDGAAVAIERFVLS